MEHILFTVPAGEQSEQIAANSSLHAVSARHKVPGRALTTVNVDTIFLHFYQETRSFEVKQSERIAWAPLDNDKLWFI